jgi:phosphopantetheinyl transferase
MIKVYNFLPTPPPIFEISYLEKEPDIYFLNDFEKNLCNFIIDKRRYEWICSRYIVKKLVSTYLNIDFKSITILNDPNGKPFVIAGKDIFYT